MIWKLELKELCPKFKWLQNPFWVAFNIENTKSPSKSKSKDDHTTFSPTTFSQIVNFQIWYNLEIASGVVWLTIRNIMLLYSFKLCLKTG